MPNDKSQNDRKMWEIKNPTLEGLREMARKVYVRQMREIIEEMRNTQTPTLDGLKEIARKRAYARRMMSLRTRFLALKEKAEKAKSLEKEGGDK